jgi:hypothetical protein
MKRNPEAVKRARTPRHVNLGDRLAALARIRRGAWSIDEAAGELGVSPAKVVEWQRRHRDERLLSFEEARSVSPQAHRLRTRAQHLARLVEQVERQIRELHQELLQGAAPFKQFGQEVAPMQETCRTNNRDARKPSISLTRS